ncbi:MAG: site-2 protease family protein, partial [Chitinophagaceae bacterium]|nr:site-2 protease family protein [Chitinophagaceae bacterium]
TWRMTTLSLNLMYKMITAKIDLSGIAGPIGIAEGAGIVAHSGIAAYLSFLALISIGLGIVNILPIPVLDGGYLLYFLIEIVRGRPLSDKAQLIGIKIGFAILFCLLLFASYNDIMRLLH